LFKRIILNYDSVGARTEIEIFHIRGSITAVSNWHVVLSNT